MLKGDFTVKDIVYEPRRSCESELLRYRSRPAVLDINRIERTLVEQPFRFQRDDIDGLGALLIVEVGSARKEPGRDALCLALAALNTPTGGVICRIFSGRTIPLCVV